MQVLYHIALYFVTYIVITLYCIVLHTASFSLDEKH